MAKIKDFEAYNEERGGRISMKIIHHKERQIVVVKKTEVFLEMEKKYHYPKHHARYMVNYVRHELTNYDKQCRDIAHVQHGRKKYRDIVTQCYRKIAQRYPVLRDECARQMHGKLERV